MNTVFAFVVAILTATSPFLRQGVRGEEFSTASSTTGNWQERMRNLKEGQEVHLPGETISLNETLFVDVSHVRIRGASGMTMVRCPQGGGAFAVRGTNVTLENLNITGCMGGSAVLVGYHENSSHDQENASRTNNPEIQGKLRVRVESCIFEGNSNPIGGAISVYNTRLIIRKSIFSNNRAEHGGAIHARFASLRIQNCEFEGNAAERFGAAGKRSEAEFRDVGFDGKRTMYRGGAVYSLRSSLTVERSNFAENKAQSGGALEGILLQAAFLDVKFTANTAWKFGGAVCLHQSDVTMEGAKLTDNFAHEDGGALRGVNLTATFLAVDFEENEAEKSGGAVDLHHSVVTMERSKLANNRAHGDGGALRGANLTATFLDVELESNNAGDSGGAVHSEDSKMTLARSSLTNNSARSGGALRGIRIRLSFREVQCETNAARDFGGAVHLLHSKATVKTSKLVNNNAIDGGALDGFDVRAKFDGVLFEENRAKCDGGALRLHESTAALANSNFTNNIAADGGALSCEDCERLDLHERVYFRENVAYESGGGLNLHRARTARIKCASFLQNVAYHGGGVKVSDCDNFTLKNTSSCKTLFKGNVAVEGGAVHAEPGGSGDSTYKIAGVRFEKNRAVSASRAVSLDGDEPNLRRWIKGRKRDGLEQTRTECPDCLTGKGGALFIDLPWSSDGGKARVYLERSVFNNNSAMLGGACYFDALRSDNAHTFQRWCSAEEHKTQSCSLIQYTDLRLRNNYAELAGGAVFMSTSKDPLSFCEKPSSKKGNASSLTGTSCFDFKGNKVKSTGYGPDFATDAASLHWKNVDGYVGGLRSGEKLSIGPASDSGMSTGLLADVWDACNQTITTGVDSSLPVVVVSNWTIAVTRYTADRGVIDIDSTTVLGVDIVDTLVLRSDDERRLSIELGFSTEPCGPGEIEDASGQRCVHCPEHLYMFSTAVGCKLCEEFAFCNKTTGLIPVEGYWHSTPYSPLMRRCPVEKACSGDNRRDQLLEYYSDYSKIRDDMDRIESSRGNLSELDFADYLQCAEGYTGVLCGECEAGYGHVSSGECEKCSRSLGLTRFLTMLVVLALFGVFSLKVLLEIVGVRKDVAFELDQQRREARKLLEACRPTAMDAVLPPDSNESGHSCEQLQIVTGGTRQASGSSQSTAPPNADERPSLTDSHTRGTSQPEQSVAPSAEIKADGEPPLTDSNDTHRPRPELTRATFHIDAPRNDERDDGVSKEAMDAAGVLSETYNILFNYVQLNSIALFLNIDWKGAVKTLLSFQTFVGRLLRVGVYPLDCSFSDREGDTRLPNSIAVLLLRSTFPWVTASLCTIVAKIWSWRRDEARKSRYKIDIVPPIALIVCSVYFSYCIDLVSDLLRVMNCIRLHPVPEDHPYAMYEILPEDDVWAVDTALTCWEGRHLTLAIFAAIGLSASLAFVVFSVGVLCNGKKSGKLRDPKFRLAYGFLFLKYRHDGLALYWKSVILARQMLFAVIGVYSQTRHTTNAEIGLFSVVLITAIVLQQIVKPFDQQDSETTFPSYAGGIFKFFKAGNLAERWVRFNQCVTLNGLEGASLFMSLSFFVTATSINDDAAGIAQEYILLLSCFFLNSLFFFFMVYRIWCVAHRYLDILAWDRSVKFRGENDFAVDCNSWLFTKVWTLFWRNRHRVGIEFDPMHEAV